MWLNCFKWENYHSLFFLQYIHALALFCLTADAGQLELKYLFKYQTAAAGQCNEACTCREEWGGL